MVMPRKLLSAIILGVLVVSLNNCIREPDELSPEDEALGRLSATWKASEVILDGVVQPGYTNFALTIAGTPGATSYGYTTIGRPTLSPWRSSGIWTFGSSLLIDINRDPNTNFAVPITYAMSNDGTQLELTFIYQMDGEPGRLQDVKGAWVFKLKKQ